jgi:hypothetical protein
MNSKKILIVTYGFHPVQSPRSFRATELAVELSRQGHEVTILGPNKEGIEDFLLEHGLRYISYGDITWRVPQLKGSSRLAHLFNRAMVRGLGLLMEYPAIQLVFLVRKKLKQLSGFDGLISIAVPYPLHWAVASIWKKEKDKNPARVWTADCGDPYYGRENDSFRVPFYFAWVEKWFMNKADYITIPFQGGKKVYFNEFQNKIIVIPQGLHFPELSNNYIKENSIKFAYAGHIGAYRDFALPFFKELELYYEETQFTFLIFTNEKQFYKSKMNAKLLKKCQINNYVERIKLLNELNNVDFLIYFPYRKVGQKSFKLIDYTFLNKPILEYKDDGQSKINLKEFFEGNYINKMEMDDIEEYKIENVTKKFIELISKKINK